MWFARLLALIVLGAGSFIATGAEPAADEEFHQLVASTTPPTDVTGLLRLFQALARVGFYERDDLYSHELVRKFFSSVPDIRFELATTGGAPGRADFDFYGPPPGRSFEDVVKALGPGWKRNNVAEMLAFQAHIREFFNPPLPPTTHPMGRTIITYPAGTRPIYLKFDDAGQLNSAGIQFGPEGSDETVIPIELIKDNAVAAAKINGVPVTLAIDSGGGAVALKPEIITRVNATRTQQATFTLSSLELGGTTFSNVTAREASGSSAQSPGDGIVGREFLNQFVVIYDYGSQRITLFPSSERRAADSQCRGTTVPMVADREGLIVTMAQTDQQMMRMLWDSGATHSLVKKTFADEHKLPVESPFYTSERFRLGPTNFGPLQFGITDLNSPSTVDGYVGHDFFATHVVCIDPFNQVIKIPGY